MFRMATMTSRGELRAFPRDSRQFESRWLANKRAESWRRAKFPVIVARVRGEGLLEVTR